MVQEVQKMKRATAISIKNMSSEVTVISDATVYDAGHCIGSSSNDFTSIFIRDRSDDMQEPDI